MIPVIHALAPEQLDVATAGGVVLLDFWPETCPPCRVLEPGLEAFVRRHSGELTA